MNVRRRLVSVLALCLAMAALGRPAQAQEGTIVQIHAFDDSTFPTLTVAASVLDANGRPITGLTIDDFEVLEDGTPGTLLDVQPVVNTNFGIAVVLAVDVSSSMAGGPLTATQQAATAFVDSLGDSDEVAVLSFADTVQVVQDFTSDKAVAKSAIQNLTARGRTALYDGAFHAVQLASEANLSRRMVVLLSDANEYGGLSLAARGDAFVAARDAAVPVYTIALGNAVDVVYMRELATLTGGDTLVAPTPAVLATRYEELSELLRSQYVLSVGSSVPGDGQPHTLTMRLTDSGAEASRTFASHAVAPRIAVSGLEANQTLSERASLTPSITSQGAVAEVSYILDGQPVSGNPQPPYSLVIDPHDLAPGPHTLTVKVRDAAGNAGQSQIPFNVPSLPPTATLPILSGAETLTEAIVLEPDITSQSAVRQVTYTIDGSPVHTTAEAPYRYTLNPADLRRGEHTLAVVVEDQSGQQGAAEFSFTVGRAPLNLLVIGLGFGGLVLGTLLVLLLAGVVLVMRRRPVVAVPTEPAPIPEGEAGAWLRVDSGGDQRGEILPLGFKRVVIGRSPRCDYVLDDVQRFVSREHAAVWWQDARYMIEDLNSTRGTYVNGRRLEGRHRLSNGDEIRLGSYILVFQELIYDEDMELTRVEPSEAFVHDTTQETVKTDSLKEKERRARRRHQTGRS